MHVPDYYWKTAKINIKFTKIEEGVNIHLFGDDGIGDGVYNLKKALVDDDPAKTPVINTVYKLNQDFNMTVVAYPEKDSRTTDFEFEFWITGE